jgi:death-on-curing protein
VLADFYPTVFDAVALHAAVMEATGAAPEPLLNEGALEGALNRPRMAAHYEDANLPTQTVLLLIGVALNHPFRDGNKRTALAVADTFLDQNGWIFSGDYLELARRLVDVVALTDRQEREAAISELISWLDPQLVPTHALPNASGPRLE